MSTNGPVVIQGCAARITRLNPDGSPSSSSVAMIQDDRPLVKLECKPVMEAGVEITPKSACGIPVISYKDWDRYKRWEVSLTWGDFDPEALELFTNDGALLTATGTAGRTFADGVLAINENTLTSAADADFVASDVGRSVVDPGFTVASCTTTTSSADVTTSGNFITSGVVAGMTVTGAGIPTGTKVLSVNSATDLTLTQDATADATVTLTFLRLPAGTYVTEFVTSTEVRMSNGALAGGTGLSITLGAQPVATIGYQYPRLLEVQGPSGVSIEVWEKAIVRGTGYQGTTPYPSTGTPIIPGSPYVRLGVFRAFLWHEAFSVENKEQSPMFQGWAIENPNFGTGPLDDWRQSALPGEGPAVPTVAWANVMADFELPSPLQPGYQTP